MAYWQASQSGSKIEQTCGADLGEADRRRREVLEEETTPWHFKLLVVALVLYLGWRFVELFA